MTTHEEKWLGRDRVRPVRARDGRPALVRLLPGRRRRCVGAIRDSGGTVVVEPFDFPFGRLLVAKGPAGEDFSVMSGGPGS